MWLKLLKTFELVTWVVLLIFSLGLIYNSILIILLDLGFKNYHPFFNPTIKRPLKNRPFSSKNTQVL